MKGEAYVKAITCYHCGGVNDEHEYGCPDRRPHRFDLLNDEAQPSVAAELPVAQSAPAATPGRRVSRERKYYKVGPCGGQCASPGCGCEYCTVPAGGEHLDPPWEPVLSVDEQIKRGTLAWVPTSQYTYDYTEAAKRRLINGVPHRIACHFKWQRHPSWMAEEVRRMERSLHCMHAADTTLGDGTFYAAPSSHCMCGRCIETRYALTNGRGARWEFKP